MNRKKHLQMRVQKLVDAYLTRHKKIPHFECRLGYWVSEVTEEEWPHGKITKVR